MKSLGTASGFDLYHTDIFGGNFIAAEATEKIYSNLGTVIDKT